ncbi:MAG: 3-oxoacyl-ACP reductase FabG [Gammaproteobacteria bacterium]
MIFDNKVALVTGASRGIGHAIALALGRQGAYIVGTATTPQGAEALSQAFIDNDIQGRGMVLNVASTASLGQLMNVFERELSPPSIVVNNAAVTRDNLLLRMKDDEWESVINTNLNSVYRVTKACLKPMIKARWGRIINLTSVVGVTGNAGQCNYAAAKAGVIGFTKTLAQEIASRDITVNAIAPGFIDTDMTRALSIEQQEALLKTIPLNRLGQVDDIAAAALFLASPVAGYITGQTLHVNGGMYMN